MGSSGLTGPVGAPGAAGPPGPTGPVAYLNPPPGLQLPIVAYPLLFHPEGIVVENPGPSGIEIPNGLSRRIMDLTKIQAVRAQWAHNLADAPISLQLQYSDPFSGIWLPLTDKTGTLTAAYQTQSSEWVATPRFLGSAVTVRAFVFGPGTLSPKITYVTMDGR